MRADPLRDRIEREMVVEHEGWAAERVTRAADALQRDVAAGDRIDALVVWTEQHTAFTGPGRTIYVSRRLLERLPDDDSAAFVIAHEMAHHRLGHIPALAQLSRVAVLLNLQLGIFLLEQQIESVDNENDADLFAIEMCLDAGYDADRCLAALEQMTMISLDYGDIDGTLGPEGGRIERWLRRRERSHPPLAARIAAIRAHVEAVARGHRISPDISRDRRRARRKKIAIAAASAAGAIALLVLRRRAG